MFFTSAEPPGGPAPCVYVILLHGTRFLPGFLVKLAINTIIPSSPSLCYFCVCTMEADSRCFFYLFSLFWHPGLADICHGPDNGFLICSVKEAGRAFCGMWTCCKRNRTDRLTDGAGAREKSQHDKHHYLPKLDTGNY